MYENNLAVLTGRNDGTLLLEDSPLTEDDLLNQMSAPSEMSPFEAEQWLSGAVQDMHESWLNMMNFEIELVNFIVNLGDLIWPAGIILLWIYSIYEGIGVLYDRDTESGPLNDAMVSLQKIQSSISESIASAKLTFTTKWSEFDRRHNTVINKINKQLNEKLTRLYSASSDVQNSLLSVFTRGSTERNRKLEMYGRESSLGSWIAFSVFLTILLIFLIWLPIAESDDFRWKKVLQVSNVLITLSIFVLMAFSLNLHTGYTGMVNFGVIFFVAIGTITVGILTAPKELHGYGWGILPATLLGITLAALFGWALAYPTARLRTDYFAIVTISLGEIVRVLLAGEPLLRVGAVGSAIGISSYPLPLEDWWFCGSEKSGPDTPWISPDACRDDLSLVDAPANHVADLLNLGEPAPYIFLLMIISLLCVAIVWKLLSNFISSPWGRVLKAIREDEEVAQHHGHDILTHKAASLALGAAIAGLAGAIWAWKLTGFEPTFMSPARSTFLVWAAFIIGGTSNNKGMVVGAFIIVLMEFVFNVLVAGQGSPDLPLYTTATRIDDLFSWMFTSQWEAARIFIIVTIIGFAIRSERVFDIGASGATIFIFSAIALGERSIEESFFGGVVSADMLYVKLLLIGCLMLFSLKFNAKGLLPEVPVRPERPSRGETSE